MKLRSFFNKFGLKNVKNILCIETSCDDTAITLLNSDAKLLKEIIMSQKKLHEPFGGVVPQLASRQHELNLNFSLDDRVLKKFIKTSKIDYIAITTGPGIGSSLNSGLKFASTISKLCDAPIIGINHLV
jgi:N6-L-threonylcarbamoyladenine synthase